MGAKYLSRPDSKVVAMLGSGGMARTYLRAFCAVRPIEKVRVYSPTKAHREEYADEMSEALGLEIQVVDNPQDAVRGADIVSAATDAMTPVVLGDWLEPGMHVTNLGNYELDSTVFDRGDMVIKGGLSGLIPNDPAQRVEVGRGHSPVAYIAGTDEEVNRLPPPGGNAQHFSQGTLPSFVDLASGKHPGRTSDDQISVYLNGGNQGLQFAAAGYITYQRCKEQGLGRELPTEWFLQDIRD